jgi:hypothetical protein
VTDEPTYHDIQLGNLYINDVKWEPEQADHIRHRAERKGQVGDMNIEPEWATEAAVDPFAIRRLPHQQPSRSLIVVGWSAAAEAVLRVFVIPLDLTAGLWQGTTAAKAADRVARQYRRNRKEQET